MSRPVRSLPVETRDSNQVFRIRAMHEADVHKVMVVERESYEFPWTDGIFRDCLRVGYHCRYIEQGVAPIGHGIMSLGAGEAHLLNVCVRPAFQRRGIGRRLTIHLLDIAKRADAKVALLEVRESNAHARRLYAGLGFNEIAVRHRYYPTRRGREDALVLALDL